MKTAVETITPENARAILKGNTGNRAVRHGHVMFIAEEMRAGRWAATHQGICIATTGRLLDGQHRLLAIVESGVPVAMSVTRGADESTYRYLDIQATRRAHDRIRLISDDYENQIACQIVGAYLKTAVKGGNDQLSIDQIEDTFLAMTEGFMAVARAFRTRVVGVTRAGVGAALATYWQLDPLKAGYFTDWLLTGANLAERSPVLLLRNALTSGRIHPASVHEAYWKTVSAIKAHSEGRDLSALLSATEDLMGNRQTRLALVRAKVAVKGAQTKRAAAAGIEE